MRSEMDRKLELQLRTVVFSMMHRWSNRPGQTIQGEATFLKNGNTSWG